MEPKYGSVASTKFNRFQLKKFKCHKINSIENQHFSYLSDSIFHKEKQKNRQMRQNPFYNWYNAYLKNGYEGLARKSTNSNGSWNRINTADRDKVVEIALEKPELSSRELAWYITDNYKYYISESSVYRILKANGLITTPSFRVMSASDSFHDKTTAVNQMWQTDFTYFKIFGWGWYYLSTVLDDYSRYIVNWKLCATMKAEDVKETLDEALFASNVHEKNTRPLAIKEANVSQKKKDTFLLIL
jgi:transposase InsO family protein